MFVIYGTTTHNTTKVLYVAEALELDYKYVPVNLAEGEHKQPEHLKRHPFGKVPVLDHDGKLLFESGAICRYLPNAAPSDNETYAGMYPLDDHHTRGQIDQWMDFFTAHLGRWLGTAWFERFFREKIGAGKTDKAAEKEALDNINAQTAVLDKHLAQNKFLVGDQFTVADAFAFAYFETIEVSGVSLADYPNVREWYDRGKSAPAVKRARKRLEAAS